MAEKKYIGKPGKQDDPCWKGYQMVGMKKKGGRKVPNCVPESVQEIMEKAKKKSKKDWTGAKIDKDRFILPEEQDLEEGWGVSAHSFSSFKDGVQDWADNHTHNGKVDVKTHVVNAGGKKWHQTTASHKGVIVGTFNHTGNGKSEEGHGRHAHWSDNVHEELEEALTRVTSGNKGYGYHGNVEARDEEERDKRYSAMHRHAKNLLMSKGHLQDAKKPNVMVRHFLDSSHGRHIAHNPTEKEITSRFKHFSKNYDPAMHEEVELEEGKNLTGLPKSTAEKNQQYIEITHHLGHKKRVPVHPLNAFRALNRYRNDPSTKSARIVSEDQEIEEAYGMWKVDFPKQHAGKAVAAGSVHVKAQNSAHAHKVAAKRVGVDHKMFKSKVTKSSILPEELGRDNEWGRPELRKKFAKVTPGQETMEGDTIPTFDARYDDVTTQYCGGIHTEETLTEISAKGAVAREKFRAKLQKRLADPKAIAKAKKILAKKKEEEKKAPKNLVHQLHKSISVGSKVKFHDGKEHDIAPNHADKFMSKYHGLKSSIEKESLVKRAHKSHEDFMKAIHEETCDASLPMIGDAKPCTCDIEGPNYPTPPMNSDILDYNEDGREDEYDDVAIEADVANEIESSEWEELSQYYDDDDLEEEDDEEGEELEEGITPQGRLKKKFNAMRTKTRRNMARNLALKRVATPDRIKSRSVRAARNMVYKRMLRGRDRSTLSTSERTRIEAQVKRMAPMVARLSIRLQTKERQIDRKRVTNRYKKKK